MVQNHSNLGYILRGVIGIQNEEEIYKDMNILIFIDSDGNYITTIQRKSEKVEAVSKRLSAEYLDAGFSHPKFFATMYPKQLLDTWDEGIVGRINTPNIASDELLDLMETEVSDMVMKYLVAGEHLKGDDRE